MKKISYLVTIAFILVALVVPFSTLNVDAHRSVVPTFSIVSVVIDQTVTIQTSISLQTRILRF